MRCDTLIDRWKSGLWLSAMARCEEPYRGCDVELRPDEG